MFKYKIGNALGDGSFGTVVKAINQETGQVVAIKKMKRKYPQWQECIELNQVKVLSKLHHPNIISLHQVIKHQNQLYFVFEYMNHNVFQLLQAKALSHTDIRNILFQTLQALAYMHRHGYFHRDLKPQNLLQMNGTIKIADLGLVREIRAEPPFTEYVSTRWYRAPEVLLHARNYSSPMDMFAIGAIMGELYRNYPMYPGSNERDQLDKILQVMGTPSKEDWPEGYKLASGMNMIMPVHESVPLASLIPQAPPEALSLMHALMQVNPQKRITAQQAIQHEYFRVQAQQHRPQAVQNASMRDKGEVTEMEEARYRAGRVCKI